MTRFPNKAHLPQNIIDAMTPEQRKEIGVKSTTDQRKGCEAGKERVLQADCERYLLSKGVTYLHISHRAREKQGWPDLVFPWRGRFYGVELKTSAGKLTKDQEYILAGLERTGAVTAVVRSLAEFIDLLNKHQPESNNGN